MNMSNAMAQRHFILSLFDPPFTEEIKKMGSMQTTGVMSRVVFGHIQGFLNVHKALRSPTAFSI